MVHRQNFHTWSVTSGLKTVCFASKLVSSAKGLCVLEVIKLKLDRKCARTFKEKNSQKR
jgi:hypothetical protein